MKKSEQKDNGDDNQKTFDRKWGASITSLGWTGVPNILIERQQALKLTSLELNLILILLKFWWEASNPPYPSKRVIGEMLGKDESTIRRTMKKLEDRGLIQREGRYLDLGGQTSNRYVMTGLIKKLEEEARQMTALRQSRQEQDAQIRRGAKITTTA